MIGDKRILTAGPSITAKEIAYVNDAVNNGWNAHWNDYLVKFEKSFAEYVGVKHAMTTSSCTGALHLSLKALGIGPGDEVIVPDITWVATAAAVTYCGAKPVFADIELDSWCMAPESIKSNLSSKTKAIMPVHNYGNMCNMDALLDIAHRHDLLIVEDAAPALGATWNGRKAGSFGHAAAFSFQGAKIMTTGEGGMFVTNNTQLFERVKKIGDHGRSLTKALWNDEIGYKYKMSNIQAALGLAQLERIDELVDKKRLINSWYKRELSGVPGIQLNSEAPQARNIYWMSTIILDERYRMTKEDFIAALLERNVDSRPVFYPMSDFPMFESAHNKNARRISLRGINLPSGHNLTEEEIVYVCCQIRNILET